ncbi:hypothetical protein GCM10009841_06500 [Microlunatus panaciterrae]|uniref:Streptomycin 6-kinase n=1 Tax=Microlunatus panaciterrae TaxID=400768 RepID=A0ABS2RI74_9ACTN|nr:aminoglycoside phosphotransferase family protein [Microlunatus panaciterrae]MBM7798696.1 streptomycin 6-kinase [Microlunatus panaciterrae]
MSVSADDLPELVRRKLAHQGVAGLVWLAALPDVVSELERAWSITVGRPMPGGSTSFVAVARTDDGSRAVLKVALPGHSLGMQADTLRRADGRGYARLLGHQPAHEAILLEGLGTSMDRLDLSPERMIELLCQTLRQAWQVPAAGKSARPEEEKAAALGRFVQQAWEEQDHPCSERVIALALEYADRRAAAFSLDRSVVAHGDPHPANALAVGSAREGAESGFVFVDPDGFLCDRGYDLGVILRDWRDDLAAGHAPVVAQHYCQLLAQHSGVSADVIWEWGFLERVSTGLYARAFGAADLGQSYLDSAESLL